MADRAFRKAYARGVRAAGRDYRWHWRVHVGLWAATCASRLAGDFVECGVNRGFLSSAIMDYLDWDNLGKHFYLLDTFKGVDERFISAEDKAAGAIKKNSANLASGFYVDGIECCPGKFLRVEKSFIDRRSNSGNVAPKSGPEKISYLHLDMNCSTPEVAAAYFFWERLVPGALILLDDYAYHGYRPQKVAMDAFADAKGNTILSLPTGQGLLIKPSPPS